MSKLVIRTNNHWRPFVHRHEVSKEILDRELDWTKEGEDDDHFFKYHGTWYHLSMFLRTDLEGWDGIVNESAWTGVLIKLSSDMETYKIASYRSEG